MMLHLMKTMLNFVRGHKSRAPVNYGTERLLIWLWQYSTVKSRTANSAENKQIKVAAWIYPPVQLRQISDRTAAQLYDNR